MTKSISSVPHQYHKQSMLLFILFNVGLVHLIMCPFQWPIICALAIEHRFPILKVQGFVCIISFIATRVRLRELVGEFETQHVVIATQIGLNSSSHYRALQQSYGAPNVCVH